LKRAPGLAESWSRARRDARHFPVEPAEQPGLRELRSHLVETLWSREAIQRKALPKLLPGCVQCFNLGLQLGQQIVQSIVIEALAAEL
jgi:hypothetical protein